MAIYRQIHLSFWTDPKIDDDFTPEDKYFYLYLLSNPHTSLCGCYEISMKQMERETGYNSDTISRLIKRLENIHKVIKYSKENKEMLVVNWYKYNWNESCKLRTSINNIIKSLKTKEFKDYLTAIMEGKEDRVCIGYLYPMDTPYTVSVTVPVTDTVSDYLKDNEEKVNDKSMTVNDKKLTQKKNIKHKHGEYGHVLLYDDEMTKLLDEYGTTPTTQAITYLDEYMEMNGKSYKSCYLALKKWVFDAVNEKAKKSSKKNAKTLNDILREEHEKNEQRRNGKDTEDNSDGLF